MIARLFDGTEISFHKEDILSIEIEEDDYSILIWFDSLFTKKTGYKCERAEFIKI